MPLVSLSGVSLSYGERTLLDAVNLTIATGTRMALVGPNGSGKTTLMRILAGTLAPDTGSVVREKETRVSYVPQSGVVHGAASLREEAENAFARGHAHRRRDARAGGAPCRDHGGLARGRDTAVGAPRPAGEAGGERVPQAGGDHLPRPLGPGVPRDRPRAALLLLLRGLADAHRPRPGDHGRTPTSSCWTSRPTTSTWRRARGWRSSCATFPAGCSWSRTTGTSST